ncbi:MAG: HEAT repeat domain-containing protein, partial [Methanospirillum sp.]
MEKEKQSVSELVQKLVQGTTYDMLDAAEAVAAHGEGAVSAIADLLGSAERETRWRAAVALERIGAPAVDALVAAAGHENYLVRVPAIWALEHIGDARAVGPLVENLNGKNECCRWMAAAALSKIGGEHGRAAVETAFADDPA